MNPNLTPFLVWGILAWVWGIPLLTCISVMVDVWFLKKSKSVILFFFNALFGCPKKKKKKEKERGGMFNKNKPLWHILYWSGNINLVHLCTYSASFELRTCLLNQEFHYVTYKFTHNHKLNWNDFSLSDGWV